MVTIRHARTADAPLLLEVERSAGQAFRQLPELAWIADDDIQSEERHRELIGGGAAWVAADPFDRPVGFLSGELLDGNLHVWELAVRHDQQGKGVGRELLEAARNWSVSHNLSGMTLTTFRAVPWNEPFYRSSGFQTLATDTLPVSLSKILRAEIKAGLPGEQRCAMRLELSRD